MGAGIFHDYKVYPSTTTVRGNTIQNNNGIGVYGADIIENNIISDNTGHGVKTASSISGTTIRNNTISGNQGDGILIDGGGYGVGSFVVSGNAIGEGDHWTAGGKPNTGHGIHIVNSANNMIGGIGENGGNIICYNHKSEVFIEGASSRDNYVLGNTIGSCMRYVYSPIDQLYREKQMKAPNGHHGIALYNQSEDNSVGEINGIIAPNYVLSSNWSGVVVINSNQNVIAFNYVGTDGSQRNWGNTYKGIHIVGSNNSIWSNTVAYNGTTTASAGIAIEGVSSVANNLQQNLIYANGGKAIELISQANQGVTPPALSRIGSELHGQTDPLSRIDFFSGSTKSDARYFEGSTQAEGDGSFSMTKIGDFTGDYVMATTTTNSNTSELSETVEGAFPWLIFLPAIINAGANRK